MNQRGKTKRKRLCRCGKPIEDINKMSCQSCRDKRKKNRESKVVFYTYSPINLMPNT